MATNAGPGSVARRSVLAMIGIVGGSMSFGCASGTKKAYEPWTPSRQQRPDARLEALARAVLAPSSHNTQPWLVDVGQPGRLALFIDPSRRLPHADPLHRQTVISQGAFLEQLDLALRELGWSARIDHPDASGFEAAIEGSAPWATLTLVQARRDVDPLVQVVPLRHTNRRPYEKRRQVPASTLDEIARSAGRPGCVLVWITDPKRVADVAALCREAMAVDVRDRARNEETAAWFRFSDREVAERADGFGVAQGGAAGPVKWLAETFFLDRASAGDPRGSFARKAVDLCWGQASTASAFGILLTGGNERRSQVEAGRAYVRAQLAAERAGVRTQPFSQLLQEYADMTVLHDQMKATLNVPASHTVQMLFRLGFAAPTQHSPRRPPELLLRRPVS